MKGARTRGTGPLRVKFLKDLFCPRSDQSIRTTGVFVPSSIHTLGQFRNQVPHQQPFVVTLHHLVCVTREFGHVIAGYALLHLVGYVGGTGAVQVEVLRPVLQ